MKGCCEIAAMFQQVCLDCNPKAKRAVRIANNATDPGPRRGKNPCAKTVKRANAYEVWSTAPIPPLTPMGEERLQWAQRCPSAWTWYVLKKWQVDDDAPYARWFCDVVTPIVPQGEMGDVYVKEIKSNARRIK